MLIYERIIHTYITVAPFTHSTNISQNTPWGQDDIFFNSDLSQLMHRDIKKADAVAEKKICYWHALIFN